MFFKKSLIPTECCWEDNEQELKALLQEGTFKLPDISEGDWMIHMNVMPEIKITYLERATMKNKWHCVPKMSVSELLTTENHVLRNKVQVRILATDTKAHIAWRLSIYCILWEIKVSLTHWT